MTKLMTPQERLRAGHKQVRCPSCMKWCWEADRHKCKSADLKMVRRWQESKS